MESPEIVRVRPLAGGGGEASVELVEIGGRPLVLKRQGGGHAPAERRFQQVLRASGAPHLEVFEHCSLGPDEILLEYVEGSTTVGRAPSPAAFRAWGAAVAGLHGAPFETFLELDEAGDPVEATWSRFVAAMIDDGVARQSGRADGLPSILLACIEDCLHDLRGFEPVAFALCHGDLHMNNALLRDGAAVLFDKGSRTWTAPAVYDLAVVYSEAFPGARYGARATRADDAEGLAHFLSGYGELSPREAEWIDHFVLLRALRRYPNPFVPDLLTTLEAAVDRIAAGR